MTKIFFVRLAEDTTSLTMEEVVAEESADGLSLKYFDGGHTCFIFRNGIGKPGVERGTGFTPEEAAQSLRAGLSKEAERLERRARELRDCAELEIA